MQATPVFNIRSAGAGPRPVDNVAAASEFSEVRKTSEVKGRNGMNKISCLRFERLEVFEIRETREAQTSCRRTFNGELNESH